MDGFDDLLVPSRNILEENPFEDPFAKPRSGSPDPWSSFVQPQESHSDIDYFKSGFEDLPSTTQTTESYSTSNYDHGEQSGVVAPDPLDAATVTAEDHEDKQSASHGDAHSDMTTSRTPGFEIFTSDAEDQSQPVVEPESELPLRESAPPIPPTGEDDTSAVTSFLHAEEPIPSQLSSPQEPISSYTSPERAIVSPLDQQSPPPSIERAFASLALGGESHGGWQTGWGGHDQAAMNSSFSTPITTDNNNDDDDDDTPIGQTARFRNAGSPQVSTP